MSNVYNEPGASSVVITLKNNTYSYLLGNIGIAKFCLITNLNKFGYSNLSGNLKKCLTDASTDTNTPTNCIFYADSEGSANHSDTFVFNGSNLGIGLPSPQNRLHIQGDSTTEQCFLQLTNDTTGSGDEYDGFLLGVDGADRVLRTSYNSPIKIQTESATDSNEYITIAEFINNGHSEVSIDAGVTVTGDLIVGTTDILDALDGKQPLNANLTAIVGLSGTGFAIKTGVDTWAQRSIAVSGNGISISNDNGVSGNPTLSLDGDLAAISLMSTTGIVFRTAANTWSARALQATDIPSLLTSKITGLDIALSGKQPNITGTGNKILKIQPDGSGVVESIVSDDGANVTVAGNIISDGSITGKLFENLETASQLTTGGTIYNLQNFDAIDIGSNTYASTVQHRVGIRLRCGLNGTTFGTRLLQDGNIFKIFSGSGNIPLAMAFNNGRVAIGKGTFSDDITNKLEVEGNVLVNGSLKANDLGDDWIDVSNTAIVNSSISGTIINNYLEKKIIYKKEGKKIFVLIRIMSDEDVDTITILIPNIIAKNLDYISSNFTFYGSTGISANSISIDSASPYIVMHGNGTNYEGNIEFYVD